jgi:hypothetical protein
MSFLQYHQLPSELLTALETIEIEVKNPAALAYLSSVPTALQEYGSQGLKVQLLYILNNLSSWRGPKARETKLILKKYSKQGV